MVEGSSSDEGAIGSGAACQALERSQPWQTTGQCQQHHARRQFGLWAAREVLLWLWQLAGCLGCLPSCLPSTPPALRACGLLAVRLCCR